MKKIILRFILIITLSGFAQGYKHFTIEQGLPSNRIYKVLQDYDGFIWIATDKGLSKFDGAVFQNFSTANGLPSNDIWEIILTKDNKLWYFTRSNSLGYIYNDSIYNFPSEHHEILYPTNISTDLNHVIFRSYGKNYVLKNKKWSVLPKHNIKQVNKIGLNVLNENIDFLYLQEKPNKWLIFLKKKLSNDLVTLPISKDLFNLNGQINDSLVLINMNQGINLINLNEQKSHQLTDTALFKRHIFTRLIPTEKSLQVSSKNYWAEIDPQYRLTNRLQFPENHHLATLYRDRQGDYWGTTDAKGLYFYPKNSLSRKTYLAGQPVQFLKLFHDKLFAGVLNKGIYKYNPKKDSFELFLKNNDYFFDMLYLDDDNFALFANTATIIKRNGKIQAYYRIGKGGLAFNNRYAVRERDVITIFNKDLKLIKTYKLGGANALVFFQNHLIAGTPLGLFRSDNKNFTKINIPGKANFPVLSLGIIKNLLVIGTDGGGAYIWDGKKSLNLIPKTENLIINHIFTDPKHIWLSSQKGVLNYEIVNGQPAFNKILRKTDGLISDHVNQLILLNGNLFTSNLSGIASVKVNRLEPPQLQKIYFKKIRYNDQLLNSPYQKVDYKKNNNLSIDFGIIDYLGQEHHNFFYQLLPIQKKWQALQSTNVNFNSLEPRKYTFKIKVINPYGQVKIATFPFTIQPLWWQTDWAKILMFFLFLSVIFLIGFWTRRKELNKQRQKLLAQKQMAEFELHALRSQMNPHFVFNSLNAIQFYINDENYDKSEAYLVRFARLIRMIFEFSRKKTITLKQEINLLQSYLNLEKMRFGDDFNYCVQIDPKLNIDRIEIPTLLLQPIVENAVNHGIFHKKGKGTICLNFKYINPDTFEVIIQDDGVGIEKSKAINRSSLKKHQSRSTEILKDRIKLLNLSEKWTIDYKLTDATQDHENPYNTIIKLKISKR